MNQIGMYLSGPLSSAKNVAINEIQAGAAIVIAAVVLYLLVKRRVGEMFGYIVLGLIACVFIFSFDQVRTWGVKTITQWFGIA